MHQTAHLAHLDLLPSPSLLPTPCSVLENGFHSGNFRSFSLVCLVFSVSSRVARVRFAPGLSQETWGPPLSRLRVRVLPRRVPLLSSLPPLAFLRGAGLGGPPPPRGRAPLF